MEKTFAEAKAEWLASESSFRTAESSADSAKEAAKYAKGEFDKYAAAKDASQVHVTFFGVRARVLRGSE